MAAPCHHSGARAIALFRNREPKNHLRRVTHFEATAPNITFLTIDQRPILALSVARTRIGQQRKARDMQAARLPLPRLPTAHNAQTCRHHTKMYEFIHRASCVCVSAAHVSRLAFCMSSFKRIAPGCEVIPVLGGCYCCWCNGRRWTSISNDDTTAAATADARLAPICAFCLHIYIVHTHIAYNKLYYGVFCVYIAHIGLAKKGRRKGAPSHNRPSYTTTCGLRTPLVRHVDDIFSMLARSSVFKIASRAGTATHCAFLA